MEVKLPVIPIQFLQSKIFICDAEFYGFMYIVSSVIVGKSDNTQIVVWKTRYLCFIPRITPAVLNDIVTPVRIPPLTSTIYFGALLRDI